MQLLARVSCIWESGSLILQISSGLGKVKEDKEQICKIISVDYIIYL